MRYMLITTLCISMSALALFAEGAPPLKSAERATHTAKAGSMLSDDLTFIRRLWLDATGVPPTRERVQSFVQSTSPTKFEDEINVVLNSPQFSDRWTTFFEDLFLNHDMFLFPNAPLRNGFSTMLREMIGRNAGWDEIATAILTSDKTLGDPQNAGFLWVKDVFEESLRWDVVDDQAGWISQTMLGIRAECISCHDGGRIYQVNKGLSKMSRNDFWGLAAFLSSTYLYFPYDEDTYFEASSARIVDLDNPDFVQNGELALAYADETYNQAPMFFDGQYHATSNPGQGMRPPRSGGIIAPRYPFTGEQPMEGETRRQALARILTKDRQFARNMVNRVWAHVFNEGFVEPLEGWDLARIDPVTAEANDTTVQVRDRALLEYLTGKFIDSGYDLRELMRMIFNSRVYQWEYSTMTPEEAAASKLPWSYWRSNKRVKRLESEAITMSYYRALGVQARFLVRGMNGKVYLNAWGTPGPETPNFSGLFDYETGESLEPTDYGFANSEEMFFLADTAQSFNNIFGRGDYFLGIPRSNESNIQNNLFMMNDYLTNLYLDNPYSFPVLTYWIEQLQNDEINNEAFVEGVFYDLLFRAPTAAERQVILAEMNSGSPYETVPNVFWALMNHADFIHR